MSEKKVAKKTVMIKESHLIDLIDSIVTEAVAEKKQEWITEQAKINKSKTELLESKIIALEKKFQRLTEGK